MVLVMKWINSLRFKHFYASLISNAENTRNFSLKTRNKFGVENEKKMCRAK